MTAEELESAKQTVANSFVFNFDTPVKTLNRILRYDYYGYPRDFINQYQSGIQAVTRADVLRVARERVSIQDLTIVAVGNPQEFGKPLATLGLPVASIDLTIPEPGGAPKTDAGSKAEAAKADRRQRRARQKAAGARAAGRRRSGEAGCRSGRHGDGGP